jgi:hypothetical protein
MKLHFDPKAVALIWAVSIIPAIGLYCLPRLFDADMTAFRRIKPGMTEAEVSQALSWHTGFPDFDALFSKKVKRWGHETRNAKGWRCGSSIVLVFFDDSTYSKAVGAFSIRKNNWSLANWVKGLWPW